MQACACLLHCLSTDSALGAIHSSEQTHCLAPRPPHFRVLSYSQFQHSENDALEVRAC
jgi:hypothetical protein